MGPDRLREPARHLARHACGDLGDARPRRRRRRRLDRQRRLDARAARSPFGSPYSASKHAVLGLGGAAEVAGAIAWPCSDAASFVTGEALAIEGGLLSR
jgi:hypothetical protein